MDDEFFLNHPGMPFTPPPALQFVHQPMPMCQSLSTAMDIPSSDHPFPATEPDQSSAAADCFFESTLSSMVSSPTSNSGAISNDNFAIKEIKELIGRLGNIYTSSGDISPPGNSSPYVTHVGSSNNSCYNTPLGSPPKMNVHGNGAVMMDHLMTTTENFPVHPLGKNPILPNSPLFGSNNLPAMPGDPGFAERAARFSSFGSRSFNGRTSPFVLSPKNGSDFQPKSPISPFLGGNATGGRKGGKLQRVLSSPSLKLINGSTTPQVGGTETEGKTSRFSGEEFWSTRENSLVSGGENGSRPVNDVSSRKRKSAPTGKAMEIPSSSPTDSLKVLKGGDDSRAKRSKSNEGGNKVKTEEKEEEDDDNGSKKQSKSSSNNNNAKQKPPEPPKDYIHVRARRGQATDSHSLAERVRREKISERMKLLQDLVPGCNKVIGKALMLEEIINYVQSLQRQVEFLSMKLASVNPRLEFNTDSGFQKDMFQSNWWMQQAGQDDPVYPMDSLTQPGCGGHSRQPPQQQQQKQSADITSSGIPAPSCSMDPLDDSSSIHPRHGLPLPPVNGLTVPEQLPSLCESDLEAIVQMGRLVSHSSHPTT